VQIPVHTFIIGIFMGSNVFKMATLKLIFILLVTLVLGLYASAQLSFSDSIAVSRNHITRSAMITLGTWAVANIGSGFIIAGRTTGVTKYAWQMNGYWNSINLGLAGMGYLRSMKESTKSTSMLDVYEAQNKLEKIYYLNFGLDFGYIAAGLYIREKGLEATNLHMSNQLRGYGTSIIIQGAFLLLMDGTMILLHSRNTRRMSARMHLK
jgi:hypothetical protein